MHPMLTLDALDAMLSLYNGDNYGNTYNSKY